MNKWKYIRNNCIYWTPVSSYKIFFLIMLKTMKLVILLALLFSLLLVRRVLIFIIPAWSLHSLLNFLNTACNIVAIEQKVIAFKGWQCGILFDSLLSYSSVYCHMMNHGWLMPLDRTTRYRSRSCIICCSFWVELFINFFIHENLDLNLCEIMLCNNVIIFSVCLYMPLVWLPSRVNLCCKFW